MAVAVFVKTESADYYLSNYEDGDYTPSSFAEMHINNMCDFCVCEIFVCFSEGSTYHESSYSEQDFEKSILELIDEKHEEEYG